ncbi:hypothetical protein ACFQZE_16615 [Paenibacillus sp. GCM10027627]|uniref:hypothetical protein n=1 Tax=unclassified Paenibacillus TaxID=185978 RepID=UPI00363681F6
MKMKAYAAAIVLLLLFPFAANTAEANVIDRIKDIYETPDKLKEMQEQYDAAAKQMEAQLEQSRQQTQALIESNETYREQNEALMAENEALVTKMEQAEASRKSLYRKAMWAAGIIIGLAAAYALSVRIWRYAVWRKQGRERQGVTLP